MMPSGVAPSTNDAGGAAASSSAVSVERSRRAGDSAAPDGGRAGSSPPPGHPSSPSTESLKEEAKQAYERGDYERALACYVQALELPILESNPTEQALLLSNAAACRLQMHRLCESALSGGGDGNNGRGSNAERRGSPFGGGGPQPGLPQQGRCDGLVEAAIEDARRCTRLHPGWPGGHLRLAQALIAAGRRDASNAACNSLQTALELNPRLPLARQMLLRELRRDAVPRAPDGDSNSNSDPSQGNGAEGQEGTAAAPLPRYELDGTAVVTLADRAALSCRRAKQFVRRNVLDWFILYSLLYCLLWLAGALRRTARSGVRSGTECVEAHRRRVAALREHRVQLVEYPKQYEAFRRSSRPTRDPDARQRLPQLHIPADSCAAPPLLVSPPWSWVTDAEARGSGRDQCERMASTPRHE